MGQRHSSRKMSHDEVEELLRRNSGFSRDNLVAMYRQFRRDFPSGYITRDEFRKSFAEYFRGDAADREFCDQLYRAHDVDGNDRVSFDEFVVSLHVSLYGSPVEKLRWAFRMYDADGNGHVTSAEVAGVLKAIYGLKRIQFASNKAELNARAIMRALDLDHNCTLTHDEFVQAASRYPQLTDIIEGKV